MNHQPFETWILSGEPLSPDDRRALEAHLHTCEACRSLHEALFAVESAFRATPAPRPAEGFSLRWKARLEAERRRIERRQAWFLLALSAVAMLAVTGMLLAGMFLTFESPVDWLVAFSRQIAVALSVASAMGKMLHAVGSLLPPAWWLGMLEVSLLVVASWFISLQKFMLARRVSP